MRILAVRARAFGPFHRKEFSFRAGLNVIWGLNEAGKSSLHGAVYAGLCGMRRGRGRPTKEDEEFASLHRPWKRDEWVVELDLELDQGRTLQFIQNLDNLADCKVLELGTGRDITTELENEGTPDGARLLGSSRATLLSTIFIRQADMLRVLETASQLQDDIQRAAATAGADQTAEGAISSLKDFRSERVGTIRSNSTKPLKTAADKVAQLRARVETARNVHDDYLTLIEDYNAGKKKSESSDLRLQAGRRVAAAQAIELLEDRLERARLLDAVFPEGMPPSPSEGVERLERVRDAVAAWDQRPPESPALDGDGSGEIEVRLAALPDPPDGDVQVAPEVQHAEEAWRMARRRAVAHAETELSVVEPPKTGGLAASELRRLAEALETPVPAIEAGLEDRVEQVERQIRKPSWDATLTIALVLGAVAAGTGVGTFVAGASNLRWLGFIGAATGLSILLLTGVLWRRRAGGAHVSAKRLATVRAELEVQRATARQATNSRRAARETAVLHGLSTDATVLRRLAAELDEAESRRPTRKRWEERTTELAIGERTEAERLRGVLLARIGPCEGDLDSLLYEYCRVCEANARQAAHAARRKDLARMLANRRAAEEAHERYQRQRTETDELMRRVGSAEGISETAPERIVERLREAKVEMDRRQAARLRQREAWIKLQAILDGQTLAELEEEAEQRRRELPPPLALDEDTALGDDIEADLAVLRERAQKARSRRDSLAGQVREREENLPDVAATEEQLAAAEAELARIRRLDSTLEKTLDFMKAARDRVQRDIAPRLVGSIQPRLPIVTAGRYDEVAVDPASLVVKVRPSDGDWREATHLSHGTREQIYLLARVALAEHLVTTEESPPLVFDDVTIQFDVDRTRAFLDLLHEISAGQQVIIFSQEQEVLDWARERLKGERDQLLELTVGSSVVS